jgi:HK97 family phage portal protein
MKLFNRGKKEVKETTTKLVEKSVTFLSTITGGSINTGTENFQDVSNLNTYKQSLYLFIGVSMIRDTVSSIPLEMHRVINKDGDTEEISTDDFMTVLGRPNYLQTQMEFWKLAIAYYLLAGETFWYLERGGGNKIISMVNMRPDHVEVLLSQDRMEIFGYKFYKSNGQTIFLSIDEVLHIKNIDPTNTTRGVGVVRPATQRIITEREASNYQALTFKNQGRPDIAVFTDVDLQEEDAEEARTRWNKIYSGNNRSAAGFFGNGVKDIKLLNAKPNEMDFIQTQNFLRDDILSVLRIPKAMLDSGNINKTDSEVARINYTKEACLPILDVFLDVINNKLLTEEMGNDKFITYDNPVNEDREQMVKESTELFKAEIITKDEARDILGYENVAGGDEFYSPAGSMFELSMKKKVLAKKAKAVLKHRNITVLKLDAAQALAQASDAQQAFKLDREQNSVYHNEELKEFYIKNFNDGIQRKADTFKDVIELYNQGLLTRILEQFETLGVNPANIFDPVTEIKEAKSLFTPILLQMYDKAGNDAMSLISNAYNKNAETFYTADEIIQALELRSEFFITSMLNTDFKEMQAIIAERLEAGDSIQQIGQAMRLYFDKMSVARAKTIARTETARIINKGTLDAHEQSAFVTGSQWLTSKDSNVRDNAGTVNDHTVNDGKVRSNGEMFPNGETYPGELTINCRCALAPVV